MQSGTHFRPRPVDVNVPLPIISDPKLLSEIDAESSHYVAIVSERKKKSEVMGEDPIPAPSIKDIFTPTFRIVETDADSEKDSPLFELPEDYIQYQDPNPEDLDKVVEYDLDGEDFDFLQALNQVRNKKRGKVSEEELEVILDFLEKESRKVSFLQYSNPSHPFVIVKHPPKLVCSVCNKRNSEKEEKEDEEENEEEEEDDDEENLLLSCEKCKVLVHENCYGVLKRDFNRPWLCSKCEKTSKEVNCIFCPDTSGAFKATVDGRWAHVTCSLWIPEVSFEDLQAMEPINSISNIPHHKWNQKCSVCCRRNGISVKCCERGCSQIFHVTCARRGGQHLIQKESRTGTHFLAYCRLHSFKRELSNLAGKFSEKRISEEVGEKLEDAVAVAASERKELLSIQFNTLASVYLYWKFRRGKSNLPLLRRLQNFLKPNENMPILSDKESLHRMRKLRQDLERVRLILDMLKRRESLKRDIIIATQEEFEQETLLLSQLQEEAEAAAAAEEEEEEQEQEDDDDDQEEEDEIEQEKEEKRKTTKKRTAHSMATTTKEKKTSSKIKKQKISQKPKPRSRKTPGISNSRRKEMKKEEEKDSSPQKRERSPSEDVLPDGSSDLSIRKKYRRAHPSET